MDVDMMIDTSAYYGSRILVLLIAAVVCFIIFEMQKKKIERLTTANVHSSIVLLHKRHAGDPNYASMTEISRIDGLRSGTFLYCVGVPAVYLAPGEHLLEVRAKWSRHIRGNRFKGFEAGPQYINVEVGHGEFWSLEYRIKEKKFVFTKCNPNKMYKYA